MTTTITPRLRTRYNDEIRAQLKDTLELDNIMLVPKIEKIVLNMGVGDAVGQAKLLEGALSDMETIAGQKPVITRAKKSLASFKLREGQAIGCKVTLRSRGAWAQVFPEDAVVDMSPEVEGEILLKLRKSCEVVFTPGLLHGIQSCICAGHIGLVVLGVV